MENRITQIKTDSPKIGIKIEGPSEERLSFFFQLCLFAAFVCVSLTLALLLIEFLNVTIPIQLPTIIPVN